MQSYQEFRISKTHISQAAGFNIDQLNPNLFPFQRDIVRWALRRGRAAIFAGTGLGKTLMSLDWARNVYKQTNKDVLLLAPLAVSHQTKREGEKFGIETNICASEKDLKRGINITNYQKLHKFDTGNFENIILDESSILKNLDGKIRTFIIETFERAPYRLACTATPASNDWPELGGHSQYLGVMSHQEMLAKYFINDAKDKKSGGKWRLMGHAQDKFWQWVASWGVMLRKPSDLGYDDGNYLLPKLNIHEIIIPSDKPSDGYLFPMDARTLAEQRVARRESLNDRVAAVVDLYNNKKGSSPWLIWCDLNPEADLIEKSLKGAIQICGNDSDEFKEETMLAFTDSKIDALVTKGKIAGHGMNWQHCSNMIFLGLSNSWEGYFQQIRRCWRFGQTNEVNVYIIISEREYPVLQNIKRKERDAEHMGEMMVKYMSEINKANLNSNEWNYDIYNPEQQMIVPNWLVSE